MFKKLLISLTLVLSSFNSVVFAKETDYFTQIKEAYLAQEEYISELDEEEQDLVQTAYSAGISKAESLKVDNPKDMEFIQERLEDFMWLVSWDKETFDEFFKSWSNSMKQDYIELTYEDFYKDEEFLLEETTVEGKAVNWNTFGEVKDDNYDYLILASYYDESNKHFYLMVLEDGYPEVLYTNSDLESISGKDFTETKNKELADGFKNLFIKEESVVHKEQTIVNPTEGELDKIDSAVAEYEKQTGTKYEKATLATTKWYYGQAVPDEVLANATVDGNDASFKTYGYEVGRSDNIYKVAVCYVSEGGDELIAFCYHNNQPVILQATEEPGKNSEVKLVTTNNEVLIKGLD